MRWVKSFLIVTRNLDVQDVYVLQMRSQRVSAFGVDTWEEAIRVCRLTPFGAVLFDVEYHHDWESVALLRQGLPQDVPIVVLTSSREARDIYQCYQLGISSYIVKPVNFDEFTDAAKVIAKYWLELNQPLSE